MKFKKIMLVSIILLAILTIGAVSASGDVASDDSAAVSDGDSIGSSVDNTDLLSNDDDDDDGDGGDDEGADDGDEGGDDDDEWEGLLFFEENAVDIQKNDTIVASVFCPENTTGIFCAMITDDDENVIGHKDYPITENNWNTVINFTVKDLNILSTGHFGIDIFLLEDLEDHWDYEFCIGGEDVYIVDSTQFRVEMEYGENINFLHDGALFVLYCPDGHVGEIVNVAVTYEDETVEIFNQTIIYNEDWISFKADELNISLDYEADYEICLTVNDGEFHEDFSLSIVHPIIITNDGYYAESLLRWDRQLASVTIPTNVAENNRKSRILLYIDGEVKFNKTLSEFKFVENATEEDPYWYNPSWGPGPGDERLMSFVIEAEAVEGNATVEVFLMLEDGREFSLSDDVEFKDTFAIAHEESGSIIQFTSFDVEVGSDGDIAVLFVPEDLNVTVIVKAGGEVVFSGLDELDAHEGLLFIQACNLDIEEEGDYEIDVALLLNGKTIVNLTADVNFYFGEDDDDWDDAENGIIVGVYEGPAEDEEDTVFFLDDEALMESVFAYVSVRDDIKGNITVVTYDEDDEIVFFNKDISEIENYEEDDENEGFTIYYLSLGDLEDFETFLEQDHFTLVFFAEDDDEEGHDYSINIDENALTFYCIDEEWPEGEGEPVALEFLSANTVTDGVIVIIPKDNLDDEIDDEFLVTIFCDDEYYQTELSLSALMSDKNSYYVKISDLDELPEIGESRGIGILVQFYIDDEPVFFAEPDEDDDNIYLFTSPYINDEVFLLSDDWVFSFRFHEEADDEFLVNVTNMETGKGSLIPFRFSDFEFEDDESVAEITLKDLNITEMGIYYISVACTVDGEQEIVNSNAIVVSLLDVVANDLEDDEILDDVTDHVFTVRVTEDMEGYVLLYVDDSDVVKNISLAELSFSDIPPFQGRKIALNDFAITEEGIHKLRVEVYNANGDLLKESEMEYDIAVGENGVEFRNIAFGAEISDAIQFNIATPIANGAYFNIYVNGKKEGKFTVNDGFELSNEFSMPFFDVSLLKSGDYVVNVTFFDGENEVFFASGEFSVNELLLTKDKLFYYEGETATISFALADPSEGFGKLRGYYIYGAGPIGWDDEMAFNTYTADEISVFWKDGVASVPFEDLEAGVYYIYVTYDLAASEDDFENDFNVTYSGGLIAVEVLEKIDPIFKVEIEDIDFGKEAMVVVTAHDEFTGTVNVTIGDLVVPVALINGTGSVVVSNLSAKAYDAFLAYEGNFKYINGNAKDTFKVNKVSSMINVDDVEMIYSTPVNVTINTINALSFKVTLDGKEITPVGEIVTLPDDLSIGAHTLTVTTVVDSDHIEISKNVTITVKKIPTIISAVYKATTYGTAGKVIVKLTDELGVGLPLENVTVTLNGVPYAGVTDLLGEAVIETPKTLPAATYTANLTFAGCIIHDASKGTVKVVVNKAANTWKVKGKVLKIKASKVAKKAVSFKAAKVMKYRKGQGTLIFKKVKGNSKIVINKKNGKVLIKKGLKKGIYTVKVKTKAYGNKNYKASAVQTVVFKIKII